ncbi:nitrite reductase small subunit NirD [Aeromicrobium sp.]|uniref:nitrite reductase small subunit NirD n=1 Tax=Aeromicrobium sp. TaxID=1871063 RepID=UPI0028B0937E|nr:nitrite reductase small subunit NirD [Aeromicrobium sp.]
MTNVAVVPEVAWTAVCTVDRLWVDRGAAALVDDEQVAIFRMADDEILAVGHRDPFTGANVIARGLVGSRGDVPTVASPLHKQVFDLRTGRCLEDPQVTLGRWDVRVVDDVVWLRRSDA